MIFIEWNISNTWRHLVNDNIVCKKTYVFVDVIIDLSIALCNVMLFDAMKNSLEIIFQAW